MSSHKGTKAQRKKYKNISLAEARRTRRKSCQKNIRFILLVFVLNLGNFSYSAAQNSGTAEALVRSIYDAHRPWDDYKSHEEEKRIDFSNEKQMSIYFDTELIALFQRDLACFEKTKMICSINVDPVFSARIL